MKTTFHSVLFSVALLCSAIVINALGESRHGSVQLPLLAFFLPSLPKRERGEKIQRP